MILVLTLGCQFRSQRTRAITLGTLPIHTVPLVGLMIGAVLIVVGLEYLPALALGPIADGVT